MPVDSNKKKILFYCSTHVLITSPTTKKLNITKLTKCTKSKLKINVIKKEFFFVTSKYDSLVVRRLFCTLMAPVFLSNAK